MKALRSIAILFTLLSASLHAQAQIEIVYPEEDPVRIQEAYNLSLRQSSVTPPDTLPLPFFDDFTDPNARPVKKSVVNTIGNPVEITNWTVHGLLDSDSIQIYDVQEYTGLNGKRFIKVLSPYTFQLYTDKQLTTPFNGNNATITALGWYKLPLVKPIDVLISSIPNPTYWIENGGAYINDRYPIEPSSYNVATFDGLNYKGAQYNTSNYNAQGFADNLTSVPIDLENVGTPDSLYLSFFWQCGGIGEKPEPDDYLIVELKDTNGYWIEVWRMYGKTTTAATKHFTRANIAITDSAYYYKGFQFRFKNRGRQSGPFDVWNVDAIYLDTNRYLNDTIKDWTISRAQHSFLKNYTAMPYKHFFEDKANQISATDSLSIINYSKTVALYRVLVEMYDATSGTNVYLSSSPSIPLSIGLPDSYVYREDADLVLDYAPLVNTNVPRAINLYYYIQRQNDEYSYLYGRNNYYTTQTILWDYYAYDDGTPEYTIKFEGPHLSAANQYVTGNASTDLTLTAVDICFTKSASATLEDRDVFLKVWNNNHNKPNQELRSQGIKIKYPDPFSGFVRYELTNPVPLSALDTFYVGCLKNLTETMYIGHDASIDRTDKLFYNDGYGWVIYNQVIGAIPGAMMIRPVFGNGQILTPVTPSADSFVSSIYPNPADDLLYIDGEVADVIITDLLGRTVLTYSSSLTGNTQHILHTDGLSEGLYLVRLTSPSGAMKTEKLLIQ